MIARRATAVRVGGIYHGIVTETIDATAAAPWVCVHSHRNASQAVACAVDWISRHRGWR